MTRLRLAAACCLIISATLPLVAQRPDPKQIVSFDPATKTYSLHSHAMGQKGDFRLTPTADGYVWEIPAGPMTIRFTAVVKDGKWREVGDRIVPGKDPIRFFEMNLERAGNSSWPEAGAIAPK